MSRGLAVSVRQPRQLREVEVAALAQAAAAGDSAAWDGLVDRFGGLVWSIARGFRLSPADAADVSQTAWLRLVENLGRLRDPGSVGAWLAQTTRHECLRTLRRANRVLPIGDDALDPPDEREPAAYAQLLRSERNATLWRAFAGLPDRCQLLLRLLTADPVPTYEQVAAATDIPAASIGPTRSRCLERLRRRLQASGIDSDDGDSL